MSFLCYKNLDSFVFDFHARSKLFDLSSFGRDETMVAVACSSREYHIHCHNEPFAQDTYMGALASQA